MEFKSILKDTIYGAVVGDAIGLPYSGLPRNVVDCDGTMVKSIRYGTEPGTWSDNTALLLATCDSIRELGYISTDDMRNKFTDWHETGKYACNKHVVGDGRTNPLTRIAPMAYCNTNKVLKNFDSLGNAIRAVSRITSSDTIVDDICIEYVHLISDIVYWFVDDHTEYILSILPELDVLEADVPSNRYTGDTIFAALWSFVFTDNYADCIIKAVNLGGDTSTIACVAGALAGTYYGYKSIPDEWLNALQDTETIEACLFNNTTIDQEIG